MSTKHVMRFSTYKSEHDLRQTERAAGRTDRLTLLIRVPEVPYSVNRDLKY